MMDLLEARRSDDPELAEARASYNRALKAVKRNCECCGQYLPLAVFFDPDVREAGERISRATLRLMRNG